jgi:hypothetical protein
LVAALLMAGACATVSGASTTAWRAANSPAGSPLLWSGDVSTGDLSQFVVEPTNNVGGTTPAVVTNPTHHGRYAIALTLNGATDPDQGICCGSRNELLPRFRDLQEGDDLWFGFSTYLGAGFPTSGGWQVITQFKQNQDGAPPLSLTVEDGQYKIEGGYGHPGGSRLFIRPVGAAVTGRWVDWVWHVRFSTDPSVGFVEVWLDGRPVLRRFAPPGGTLYSGSGPTAGSYVKTGLYRERTISEPATLYLADWRIAASADGVRP